MTYSQFGLKRLNPDAELPPVRIMSGKEPGSAECMIRTFTFLMDSLCTMNRRYGEYRRLHGGVEPMYRFTHPALSSLPQERIERLLCLVSDPFRSPDWEYTAEKICCGEDIPVKQPGETVPFHGVIVIPHDGRTVTERQAEVLTLVIASKMTGEDEDTAENIRDAVSELVRIAQEQPDRPAMAACMIMDAVLRISAFKPGMTEKALLTVKEMCMDLCTYSCGGEKELPFIFRCVFHSPKTLERAMDGLGGNGLLDFLDRLAETRPYIAGWHEKYRQDCSYSFEDAENSWLTALSDFRDDTLNFNEVSSTVYLMRIADSSETLESFEKDPFRMHNTGPTHGMTRIYVSSGGLAFEHHSKNGKTFLIADTMRMFLPEMSEGYNGCIALAERRWVPFPSSLDENGMLRNGAGQELTENLEKSACGYREELVRRMRKHYGKYRSEIPDDERCMLCRIFGNMDFSDQSVSATVSEDRMFTLEYAGQENTGC